MIRKTVSRCLGILAVIATGAMLVFAPAVDNHTQIEISDIGPLVGSYLVITAHGSTDVGIQPAGSHCHIGLACTAIFIEAVAPMPRDPDRDAVRVPPASRMTGIVADRLFPPPRRSL